MRKNNFLSAEATDQRKVEGYNPFVMLRMPPALEQGKLWSCVQLMKGNDDLDASP